MKKLLLLGALLASTAMQAQTTYYWPEKRVTELQSGSQYFIYNTAYSPSSNANAKDRTNFLFANGTKLGVTKMLPSSFATNEAKYLFTLEKPANPSSDNHWYIHTVDGYVGIGGSTVNTAGKDLYLTYWATPSNISKASDIQSQTEDGSAFVDPNSNDNKVWTITNSEEASSNPNGNVQYGWNGDANAWAVWGNAHPYAFYSVNSINLTQEANENLERLRSGYENMTAYQMQKAFGLAKEVSQYSTNAQQNTEGPIKNLIDGDGGTFFHSSWGNSSPQPTDPHYIQIDLNQEVNSIYFYTKKRGGDNTSNRPTEIRISVSTDGSNFTPIKTLTNESDGLITNAEYFSPKIESETPFRYIKFEVLATNTGEKYGEQPFFSYSEFYVFDATKYELRDKIVNNLQSYLKTATEESIAQDWEQSKEFFSSELLNEIQSIYAKISALPYGTSVGTFNKPDNYDEVVTAINNLNENTPYSEIQNVLAQVTSLEGNITINQPEPGKFYRIKGASGKYISSEAISTTVQGATIYKLKMTDATDKSTVLFLSEGNRITTAKMQNMSRAGIHLNGLGGKYTFTAHQTEIGKYVITPSESPSGQIGGTTNSPLYDYSATSGAVDQISNANDPNCAWTLEEVTETAQQPSLNKIMSAEYATLAAPVALNIPEGVKAYTITLDEEKTTATLEEVSNVIPAGTAVVLKKTGSDNGFTFTFAAEGNTNNTNDLTGVYADTEIATDINAYILGNGKQGIGFYQMNGTDRTLGANKAYLVLPAEVSNVRSIIFSDGQTTGIESTVAEGTEAEEYYDLQGRRVMNPTKGIYVTKSGKKVVINK